MDKSEHRAKIRRLADQLAKAMTEGGEDYYVELGKIEVTRIESEGREYAYHFNLRVEVEF
jgi:hypothetical protein